MKLLPTYIYYELFKITTIYFCIYYTIYFLYIIFENKKINKINLNKYFVFEYFLYYYYYYYYYRKK